MQKKGSFSTLLVVLDFMCYYHDKALQIVRAASFEEEILRKVYLTLKQNRTEQDIYQALMVDSQDYKNFLNSKFPGLKPTDNLLSLITTLASNMPNSTIAVKAANKQSVLNLTDITLQQLLHFFCVHNENEVIDLKNGFIYYMSDQAGPGLNYTNVIHMCATYSKSVGTQIVFSSDQQIRDFLKLNKMSKYCLFLKKRKNLNHPLLFHCKHMQNEVEKFNDLL